MKKLLFIFIITIFPLFLLAQQVKPDGSNWKHTGTNEYTKPLNVMGVALSNTTINAWNTLLTQSADTIELGSVAVLDADSTHNIAGHYTPRYDFKYEAVSNTRNVLKTLGAPIKILPVAVEIGGSSATSALATATLYYQQVLVTDSTLLSNFTFGLSVQGTYTGSDYNGIGIYSITNTTFTKLGETTNNTELWKSAIGVATTVNLTAPVILPPGKYVIMILFNGAGGVAPTIYGISISYGIQYVAKFPNGVFVTGYSNTAGKLTLPATIESSSFYATTTGFIVFGD